VGLLTHHQPQRCTPPPPPFGRSPSTAPFHCAGADEISVMARSEATKQSSFPRKPTGLLRCARNDEQAARSLSIVTTGLDPVVHADVQRVNNAAISASQPAAWIAGSSPAMTTPRITRACAAPRRQSDEASRRFPFCRPAACCSFRASKNRPVNARNRPMPRLVGLIQQTETVILPFVGV
jgi:hypothetical protein